MLHAAGGGRPPIVNVVDPEAPSVAEIAWTIMDGLASGLSYRMSDEAFLLTVGATPWSLPRPLICASALGHAPAGSDRELVLAAVHGLVDAMKEGRDWRAVLPVPAACPSDLLDYDTDERAKGRPVAEAPGRQRRFCGGLPCGDGGGSAAGRVRDGRGA